MVTVFCTFVDHPWYAFQRLNNKGGDQTVQMRRVVCTFVVRMQQSQFFSQCSHRLEKYLSLESFLEKSLKIKSALKSTGKSLESLEKSFNSTIFCRTYRGVKFPNKLLALMSQIFL